MPKSFVPSLGISTGSSAASVMLIVSIAISGVARFVGTRTRRHLFECSYHACTPTRARESLLLQLTDCVCVCVCVFAHTRSLAHFGFHKCAARWKTLHDFISAHENQLSSTSKLAALRSQVGSSLHHAFDLLASRVLLETEDGVETFVTLLIQDSNWLATRFDEEGRTSVFDDDGMLHLNLSMDRFVGLEGNFPPKAVKGSRCVPNLFAMRRIAPGLSLLDGLLTALDVSGHPHLQTVPVRELVEIKSLNTFECQRCPRLFSPPPEIACQGTSPSPLLPLFVRD